MANVACQKKLLTLYPSCNSLIRFFWPREITLGVHQEVACDKLTHSNKHIVLFQTTNEGRIGLSVHSPAGEGQIIPIAHRKQTNPVIPALQKNCSVRAEKLSIGDGQQWRIIPEPVASHELRSLFHGSQSEPLKSNCAPHVLGPSRFPPFDWSNRT
jgi:hypothetical protein